MHPEAERLNALTEAIIRAAIEVHKTLGPGLLESAYEACLCHELMKRGLNSNARTRCRSPMATSSWIARPEWISSSNSR